MPQVVGLDIGATSVKAAVFERGFRGLELTGFHRKDFEPGDPAGLPRALAGLAQELPAGSATIVSRMAGDRISFRLLQFPMADPRKLEQVIPFEVEQQVPYELEDVVLDHSVLRRTADGGARVLVAAARKDELRERLALLSGTRFDPRMMGAGPTALGSLAAAVPGLGKGTVALVDAGFARTDVCVLEDGRIAWARTISAGRADLVDAHAAGGGAATDLAELDVVRAGGGAGSAATQAAADFVAREIRRCLMAAETECGLYVDRIVLFGGLARTRGFAALLERTASVVVEPLALSGQEWAKSHLSADDEQDAGAAVALAFRVLADPAAAGVNFRRDEFAFKRDTRELSGVVGRIGTIAAILLVMAGVHYGVKERLLAGEKRALDREITSEVTATFPEVPKERLSSADTALSIMRGNMDEARARLEQLGGGGISALDVLREFSAAVPDGMFIDVKKFSLQEGKVQVQCLVDSYEASDKLAEALKKVEGFSGVESSSGGGSDPSGKRKVNISFDVNRGGGGEA